MILSYFGILEQVSPKSDRPFKIAETIMTSDGPRTRLCDGAWVSLVGAEVALKEKERKAAFERERASPVKPGITANIPKSSMTTLTPPILKLCSSQDKCDYPNCLPCPYAVFDDPTPHP